MATGDSKSVCHCNDSETAIYVNSKTYGHIHCPCDVCDGKAVYPMTAWRHLQRRKRSHSSSCEELNSCDAATTEIEVSACFSYSEHSGASCESLNFAAAGDDMDESEHDSEIEDESIELEIGGEAVDSDSDTESSAVGERNFLDFVNDAVMRLVEIKGKNGLSVKAFEDMLNWGKNLHCKNNEEARSHWPSSWDDVRRLLKQQGYHDPKLYWICLDSTHPCLYGLMEMKDIPCPYCGKPGEIPYYYISLVDKVKRWCGSPSMCRKMTAHWNEKDHWMPPEMTIGWGYEVKRELWDGVCFSKLSYFWDPEEQWILPVRCPHLGCHTIISSQDQLDSPEINGNNTRRKIICPNCLNTFNCEMKSTYGDPRNIAYVGKQTQLPAL